MRCMLKTAVVLAALVVPGCAMMGTTSTPDAAPQAATLRIDAATDANNRRPIAVDVVRAGDADMAQRLDALDAATWFRTRAALRREGGTRIAIASWEMVPGQAVALPSLPPFAATPVATVVYALYASPGTHRQRLTGSPPLAVRLERDGFTAAPLGATP